MRISFQGPEENLVLLDLLRAKLHGNEIEDGPSGYHPSVNLPQNNSGALSSAGNSAESSVGIPKPEPIEPPSNAALEEQAPGNTGSETSANARHLGGDHPFSNRILPVPAHR